MKKNLWLGLLLLLFAIPSIWAQEQSETATQEPIAQATETITEILAPTFEATLSSPEPVVELSPTMAVTTSPEVTSAATLEATIVETATDLTEPLTPTATNASET